MRKFVSAGEEVSDIQLDDRFKVSSEKGKYNVIMRCSTVMSRKKKLYILVRKLNIDIWMRNINASIKCKMMGPF